MTLAAKPFAAAVNHLLARESWARERLAPYAGKTARLSSPPMVLTLLVQPDGYLAAVDEHDAQHADVALSLADNVIVIERGRIIHQAASRDLLADQTMLDRLIGLRAAPAG